VSDASVTDDPATWNTLPYVEQTSYVSVAVGGSSASDVNAVIDERQLQLPFIDVQQWATSRFAPLEINKSDERLNPP
jgi:hypothetical protein